jgi:RNA polymerase sigma-70 factor (ECF subfamily)
MKASNLWAVQLPWFFAYNYKEAGHSRIGSSIFKRIFPSYPMKSVTGQELLKRAHELEEQALAEIYDRWSAGLYKYSLRLLGQADLAEECVAETFSRFLKALKDERGPRDFLQAYLYRVAHNWITDFYRSNPDAFVPLDRELMADQDDEPSRAVFQEMESQELRSALKKLTADQRQVIVLKYIEDWENEEIAAALNKPVGAVKSLQHRALDSLRRHFRRQEERENERERQAFGPGTRKSPRKI